MSPTIILILAAVGQYAQGGYAGGYAQTYAQAVYQWVPVVSADPYQYYGGLVASAVRAEQAKQAEAQSSADLNQRLADLAAQVKALADRIGGVPQPGPGPQPPPPNPAPPNPTPTPDPQPVPSPPGFFVPPAAVFAVMQNRCVKCHGAADKLPFADDAGNPVALDGRTVLMSHFDTRYGFMPKGGAPLPQPEFAAFDEWLNGVCDAVYASIKAAK